MERMKRVEDLDVSTFGTQGIVGGGGKQELTLVPQIKTLTAELVREDHRLAGDVVSNLLKIKNLYIILGHS